MNLINKARKFAYLKHKGQLYNNLPFMTHPEEVFTILQALLTHQNRPDTNLLASSLLHDILEDTDTSISELTTEFNDDIASLVQEVTDNGWNIFPNLKTQRGIMLKFADRLANLSHIHDWTPEHQQKYIEKSKFWKSTAECVITRANHKHTEASDCGLSCHAAGLNRFTY